MEDSTCKTWDELTLPVAVKWFDPRKAYGFCSLHDSPDKVPSEVFFGAHEAEAAKRQGLTLCRGEQLLCDIEERSAKCSATRLRPLAGIEAESSEATGHEEDLARLRTKLETDILPALASLRTFAIAADRFYEQVDDAWNNHAAAGREQLEAFVQGVCFEGVQGFARRTLLSPDPDEPASQKMVSWLRRLEKAPWCWSPQQRRALGEFAELGGLIHVADDAPAVHLPERISAVLQQRTQRFVVVLEVGCLGAGRG
ncbi:unnamed protein product [Effrenium voratum]|nr:unnamed protein product [Effrenium voratum]